MSRWTSFPRKILWILFQCKRKQMHILITIVVVYYNTAKLHALHSLCYFYYNSISATSNDRCCTFLNTFMSTTYRQTNRQVSIWYVLHVLKFTTNPPLQSSKFSTIPIQNTFNFVWDYEVSHLSSNDLLRNNFHLSLGKYCIFVNLKTLEEQNAEKSCM